MTSDYKLAAGGQKSVLGELLELEQRVAVNARLVEVRERHDVVDLDVAVPPRAPEAKIADPQDGALLVDRDDPDKPGEVPERSSMGIQKCEELGIVCSLRLSVRCIWGPCCALRILY